MKKASYLFILTLTLFSLRTTAQDAMDKTVDLIQDIELYFKENKACPTGYKQIYVKCGKELKPSCIVPERQTECTDCWEVHWGPCAGKTAGGMWFYNTFERANRVAYLTASSNSCPWFESSNYMIVLNDPKGCLYKPTGYEMVSWLSPFQLQPEFVSIENFPYIGEEKKTKKPTKPASSDDLNDLNNELLTEIGKENDDAALKQLDQLNEQTKALIKQAEENKKKEVTYGGGQVTLRGLAGKIESGEYDPNKPENNTNSNTSNNNSSSRQTNPDKQSNENTGPGNGSNNSSGSNPSSSYFSFGGKNYNAETCGISPTSNDCPHNRAELRSGSEYISIYNMPTASSGSFSIKDFVKCGECDLYITYKYGASYSGTLTKTGSNSFSLTCTMKDPGGKTSSLTASGTYK